MSCYDRAKKVADYLRERIGDVPDTAVVLGSGLGAFGDSIARETEIDYRDIPDFPVSTAPGHKGKMIVGRAGSKRIIAMQGRFHRYEGYGLEDVTLYVRAFCLMGVKKLVITNAAGGINYDYTPGDIMLIKDHFSMFCPSPLIGPNDERFGERFIPMNEAYDREMAQIAREAAAEIGIPLKEGVYVYAQGPQYETPAEIRALRTLGCDGVGMSTVPEVIVAAHCGIRVLGLSCISNMAAGMVDTPPSEEEVIETANRTEGKFKSLVTEICRRL